MENQKKCSLEEHKEIDAIIYCPECRIYMCNKCEKAHSSFIRNHHQYNLNKGEEIFNGYCPEKNHLELKYFCKTHNQLCCAACLCKINKEGDGQHKDCDVCSISDIKEEKKNNLEYNIKCLEDLEIKFNESIKKLKEIINKVEEEKEELKVNIQKIFTKIRNTVNDREDELLLEIDNFYNDKYINKDIFNKAEKLPKKIEYSLEKGKSINKEWDENNLSIYIYDCINLENNIKMMNEINENVNSFKSKENNKVNFSPQDEFLEEFINSIKLFGNFYINTFKLKECPPSINEKRKFKVTGKNQNILTKTGTDSYYAGTICEKELDKSIIEHKWKIKILKSNSKNIMVGVSSIDFDINASNYNTCGWYIYLYNSNLYSGPPHKYSGKNLNLSKVNDEIIVLMNMKKRTLKFIINNEDKGDSYTDIPLDKPLFPAVLLLNQHDSVEITEC